MRHNISKFKKILNRIDKPCLSYSEEINGKYYNFTLVQSEFWVTIEEHGRKTTVGCHIDDLPDTLEKIKAGQL